MASSSRPQWKYDVFLSFRGEDTRKSFVGHLYNALDQKGFLTFMDDENLERGKEISPELLKAIEQSRLAIIVFSENYASSSWCLDELLKIMECKLMIGQKVVPVFFKVDPSDVRKQTGNFEASFTKHEEDYAAGDIEKLQRWREALREAANLSGWPTETTANGNESKCIQEIVRDVFNKLGNTFSSVVEDLVGIDSRVEEVCSLLGTRLDDVCVVGIWGMGGIGKTTIAKTIYNRISHRFEDSIFLAIREYLEKHGLEALQQEVFMITSRLRCKRVLVVLDDVDPIAELEVLPEKLDWVSSGSRIIITTRDARFLIKHGVDVRYEVKALDENEALQLFSSKAFKQSNTPAEYVKLSKDIACYVAGLPLALKVLGSSLFGRNKNEWTNTLNRLKKIPNKNILQVLQISFDRLDELDQQIFLDIACFFQGQEKDFVTRILDGCDFDPDLGISVLIEKSLITVTEENMLQMHALIQEMGRYIVCQEDPKDPGKRSRLWIPEDVCHVLTENTATNAIEGIFMNIDLPKGVNFEAFKKMNNLRLLKICNTLPSQAPECLPNKLSWLSWHGYPSKSLPASFKAEKLVELCMHGSCIIELWKEKKILGKLISIDLSHSQKLRRTPDFTGLANLENLILENCTSLVEVHPSIAFHKKLIILNLRNCRSLKSLPESIQLESLNTLILSGCLKLEKFPEISNNIPCLSELSLDGTAIKELPSSIELLNNLVLINLKDCRNLKSLPDSMCRLRCLKTIDLSGCIKLEELPQNFGDMDYLEEFYVGKNSINNLSSSIAHLKNLKILSICGYKGTTSQSLSSLFSSRLLQRERQNSMSSLLHVVSGLQSLTKLDISGCNLFDWQIPSDLGSLSSLEELNLSRNNFVNVPASINQLSELRVLWLVGCNRLEALLNLPERILELYADDCTSLVLSNRSTELKGLNSASFSGCTSKRLECQHSDNLADILLKHMLQLVLKVNKEELHKLSIILPGSKIPEWFTHQNMGHSISIELPPHWYNDKLKAAAICVVSELLSQSSAYYFRYLEKVRSYGVNLKLNTRDHLIKKIPMGASMFRRGTERKVNSEHVCLGFFKPQTLRWAWEPEGEICWNNWFQLEISFPRDELNVFEVKKVGFRLVYEEEGVEKIDETMFDQTYI